MSSLLLTQCLQHDFVRPIGRYEPLPNRLHVGYSESLRLMGEDPQGGPIAQVMRWANQQMADHLTIIHLRDWHDPNDPNQVAHLQRFGPHCLQGTPGAEFAFEASPEDLVINSLSLSDFTNTELERHLLPFAPAPTKVGLVGVWTEARLFFLAYELTTRYPNFEIVICSALCASSSRARHFDALDQMERILGLRVVHSVAEFVDFLGGGKLEPPVLNVSDRFPEIVGADGLTANEKLLLRHLFRDCRELRLRVLDGGFSGNKVLGTESVDLFGHDQVPHVVKLGPRSLMGQERVSFERIQHVLGNNAPHVSEFADYEDLGGIKYRYASMGGSFSTTFQKLVEQGADQETIDAILDSVFGEQLHRLYKAATLEEVDLLEHYQFSSRWAVSVRRRVEELVGPVSGTDIEIADGLKVPNLVDFYETTLDRLKRGGRCYQAYVHGDLNGANIIVDGHQNVWLIDFFHTKRAHVLMDLIKLENDLLYIFTKLTSESDLRTGCSLVDRLLEVDDLAADLPPVDFEPAKFQTAWNTLRTLRRFYAPLVQSDRSPYQWMVGALRYAAHSLGFDECSPWQKKWALYSASRLSQLITESHFSSLRLRVDWVPVPTSPGKLGLTILPGRADRHRNLSTDLQQLKEQGVQAVVCLVPSAELESYGLHDLMDVYQKHGFSAYHLPVVDQKVCSLEELQQGVGWILDRMAGSKAVLVHCVGGLGRSGFVVAACLVALGLDGNSAIEQVRAARSPRALETAIQEEVVKAFSEVLTQRV